MTAKDPIQAALKLVNNALFANDASAKLAKSLLPLLKDASKGERRPNRRDVGEIEYRVEQTNEGEVLVERRLNGRSKPFRCPKAVHDAVFEVLAVEKRPMSVDDIAAGVEAMLRYRPAEFQIRVPLRLWVFRDPPLVIRSRARYLASNNIMMAPGAKGLWKKLALDRKE